MDLAEIHFTAAGQRYDFDPPTARHAFKASRLVGGVGTLLDRCQAGDLDAYAAVLKLGCPEVAKMAEADREDFIFANLAEVNTACTRWAVALQWGGREPHQVLAEQERKAREAGADGSAGGGDNEGNAPAGDSAGR